MNAGRTSDIVSKTYTILDLGSAIPSSWSAEVGDIIEIWIGQSNQPHILGKKVGQERTAASCGRKQFLF